MFWTRVSYTKDPVRMFRPLKENYLSSKNLDLIEYTPSFDCKLRVIAEWSDIVEVMIPEFVASFDNCEFETIQ